MRLGTITKQFWEATTGSGGWGRALAVSALSSFGVRHWLSIGNGGGYLSGQ